MIVKERVVLLVLCILHYIEKSSAHQETGHKWHVQNEIEVATVSTNVTGTGFHRHFNCQFGLPSDLAISGCHIAVQIQVPREMYFDIDQVYSAHPVSTELPVDAVEESTVWLFAGVESERFEVSLPIHMRYHPPSEHGYTHIHSLPEPHKLLINCESSSSLQSATSTVLLTAVNACMTGLAPCPWREVSFTLSGGHHQWEGRVPCGVTHAAPYVTLATVLATLLCTGYLLHALIAVSNEHTRIASRHQHCN